MELQVTVQLDGMDVPCGTLYTNVRRGQQSASFVYDRSYILRKDAFEISPDLPLGEATVHTGGKPLFMTFEDCMPDRWGRNLMLRAERRAAREGKRTARSLWEGDYLVGVSDVARQGALRVWSKGVALAPDEVGVPRETDLPKLLAQADLAATDMDADVRDLLMAGSSLGGARPKASVVGEHGQLCIAKLPKADEGAMEDVCAWEHVALVLARRCGIETPNARLVRLPKGQLERAILVLDRFDRKGAKRIPYLSGMSAVQGVDGGSYSYLELVDFLEWNGASPTKDIRQLWLRLLFSCAIGNTDDHMRNHGFLRSDAGWNLAPVFDVNPTEGDGEKYLSCAADFDERLAVPQTAIDVCEEFRTRRVDAVLAAKNMARELAAWRRVAIADGISRGSISRMESCFEAAVERLGACR